MNPKDAMTTMLEIAKIRRAGDLQVSSRTEESIRLLISLLALWLPRFIAFYSPAISYQLKAVSYLFDF
jgi:hypothetical protein